MRPTWFPNDDRTLLVLANRGDGGPAVMVRTEPWAYTDEKPLSDPETMRTVLIEGIAHDMSDEEIGSLVRHILPGAVEEARASGSWRWSGRLSFVEPVEPDLWKGAAPGEE